MAFALALPVITQAMPVTPAAGPHPGDPALIHRVAVFGADQRRPLGADRYNLTRKIGLLFEESTNSVCSAFCVSEDIVATASHCLFKTSGEPPFDVRYFSFRLAALPRSTSVRIAGTLAGTGAQNISAGSTSLKIKPPIGASQDWALVRLAAPACPAGGLPLSRRTPDEVAKLAREHQVYHAAFHRDFPAWQLAEDHDCGAEKSYPSASREKIESDFSAPANLILHTCDTGGGSSGSPLLVDGPNGPEVAGINVGTYVQSKVQLDNGTVVQRLNSENVANTAVSVLAFIDEFHAFKEAPVISTRSEMRVLQAELAARKLYSGRIDGIFGPSTRAAIERFEREDGRPATGLATAGMLIRLKETGFAEAGKSRSLPADTPQNIETGSIATMKPTHSGRATRVRLTRQR